MSTTILEEIAPRITSGTFFVFLASYGVTLVSFITQIALARLLAPADFGLYSLAFFYLTAFSILKNWGAESAVLHRRDRVKEVASTLWFFQLGVSFLTILAALVSPVVLRRVYSPQLSVVLIILALISLIESGGLIPRVLVEREIEFRGLSFLEIFAALVALVVAVLLAWRGYGVWALVANFGVNVVLKTMGFWWLSDFRPEWGFRKDVFSWFIKQFGVPVFLSSMATLFLFQFDNFLIGTFVSAAALGFYTRAYTIARLPSQLITQVISRVAFPVYSQLQSDTKTLRKTFNFFLRVIWRLALPMAVGLFVLAPEVIRILLGDKWLPAVPLLRILTVYSLARILLDDTGPFFSGGLGKPRLLTEIFAVQAVLLVVLGGVGVYLKEVIGVALVVDGVMLLGVILAYRKLAQVIELNYIDTLGKPLLAGLIALLVGLGSGVITSTESFWLGFLLKGLGVALTYGVVLWWVEREQLRKDLGQLWGYVSKNF